MFARPSRNRLSPKPSADTTGASQLFWCLVFAGRHQLVESPGRRFTAARPKLCPELNTHIADPQQISLIPNAAPQPGGIFFAQTERICVDCRTHGAYSLNQARRTENEAADGFSPTGLLPARGFPPSRAFGPTKLSGIVEGAALHETRQGQQRFPVALPMSREALSKELAPSQGDLAHKALSASPSHRDQANSVRKTKFAQASGGDF